MDGTIQKGACVSLLTALLSELGDTGRLEGSYKELLMSTSYTYKGTHSWQSIYLGVVHTCLPRTQETEQEDYEVEASLG